MKIHPASQPDDEAEAAWLGHVRLVLAAAASMAATGIPTEVLLRPHRPMARELRSIARAAGIQAWVQRSGRYLAVRFAVGGAGEEPVGPAIV